MQTSDPWLKSIPIVLGLLILILLSFSVGYREGEKSISDPYNYSWQALATECSKLLSIKTATIVKEMEGLEALCKQQVYGN